MPGHGPRASRRSESGPLLARWRVSPHKQASQGRVLVAAIASLAGVRTAASQDLSQATGLVGSIGAFEIIQIATFTGVMGAAMLSALWLIRERARIAAENLQFRERIAELNAAVQKSESLLNLRDQRIVIWANDNRRTETLGSLPAGSGVPEERGAFLAFGRWLTPRSAALLERSISDLRDRGTTFDVLLEAHTGALVEAVGRKSPSHVFVRFTSVSQRQAELARLKNDHAKLVEDQDTVLALINELSLPFWLRGADGRLKWVNLAYAVGVEAETAQQAVAEGREFLGTQVREDIARRQETGPVFDQTVATVIGGDRKMFAVTDYRGPAGAAGIAIDRSEIETMREEHERTLKSHAETLDHLTTPVAIFDAGMKLRFHNQAFQKLWDLEPSFLSSAPDNALLLDRLRSSGMLPEQPEWRRWKENLLAAYRLVEPQEHWWHLPDGRTIRVVANPHPTGGVTWIFENLTERIDLESRYQTAVKVQGETLDNLAEGVAVFGPDGRIRLSNPAFATLWRLDPGAIGRDTHIASIREIAEMSCADSPWGAFVAAVTGFDDERREQHGRTELTDGTILSHSLIPLPNGQVMITFVDVTHDVNFERALKEKNEALQKADQLKNEFVQHVSYELRSPLTNIIGFTDLLALGGTGPLNERQKEYLDHIASSSSVLLTIVNDILDLATVDAGIMELEIGETPVAGTVKAAAELVSERLKEHAIALKLDIDAAPASLMADEHRLRQILFNLLSNAANYAPEQSTIVLACRQVAEGVEFSVQDEGPGMPHEVLDTVFKRFEPRVNGGRKRGAGLGLAIVKSFVELHGGTVTIETGSMRGTKVTCLFPSAPKRARAAAE